MKIPPVGGIFFIEDLLDTIGKVFGLHLRFLLYESIQGNEAYLHQLVCALFRLAWMSRIPQNPQNLLPLQLIQRVLEW